MLLSCREIINVMDIYIIFKPIIAFINTFIHSCWVTDGPCPHLKTLKMPEPTHIAFIK